MKIILRLAMCLGLAIPAIAALEAAPVFAQLSNCSGSLTPEPNAQAHEICLAGSSGLMRAYITYLDHGYGLTFTSYGVWVGPGQTSTAFQSCTSGTGHCTVTAWGRQFQG